MTRLHGNGGYGDEGKQQTQAARRSGHFLPHWPMDWPIEQLTVLRPVARFFTFFASEWGVFADPARSS